MNHEAQLDESSHNRITQDDPCYVPASDPDVAALEAAAALEPIGYRGSDDGQLVRQDGTGVGSTVVTADGTEYEVVWSGGEGLTANHGSAMFALWLGSNGHAAEIGQMSFENDPEEREKRKLHAQHARREQLKQQKRKNDGNQNA